MATFKTDFITLPEGRFAWCFLDLPRETDMNGNKREDPKYETVFYIPKLGTQQTCPNFAKLWGLVSQVMQSAYRGDWPMKGPSGNWVDFPIDDCDADAADLEKYPWTRGHWKVRLSGGKYAPKGFDVQNNDLVKDVSGRYRNFKSGDFGMASVNAYEWSFGNSRKGVAFGLEAFKKTQDGEAIGGGGRSATEIFGGPAPNAAPLPAGVYGGAPPPQYGLTGGMPPTAGNPYPPQYPAQTPPTLPSQGYAQPAAALPAHTGSPSYPPPSGSYPPANYPNGGATTAYPSNPGMPPPPPLAPPPIGSR